MFFNILADAIEDNADLGAEAVEVARRTNNGILDATGINKILPSPVRNLNNSVYDANKKIILGVGHGSARFL